jgi:O-antigen/teichoic acid export membrane protein
MMLIPINRIFRWAKLFLEFAVNQGVAQAAGMISGLIYVRIMPVDQYALYAIAASTLAFLSVSSDLGLSGVLAYHWREGLLKKDDTTIHSIIVAVRKLRLIFLVIACIISGAFLIKTFTVQNFSISNFWACFALVVATSWANTRTTVDLLLMRLMGKLRQSYYCESLGSIARFLAAGMMAVAGLTLAAFGLVGGLLGSLVTLATLRAVENIPATPPQPVRREIWHRIFSFIGPTFPAMVVHMVQDPLIAWLALTVGGQAVISEAFAVGRIAIIYGFMGSFVIAVVAPRLASITDEPHLMRMASLFLLALALLCIDAITLAYFVPEVFLLLIGPRYAHLNESLVLAIISASLGLLITFLVTVNRLRGWVRLEPVMAATQLGAIFLFASHWSFDSSANVLKLTVALGGVSLICTFLTSVAGLFAPKLLKAR